MSAGTPLDWKQISAANESVLIIVRAHLPIFRLSGRDAERYLHGRITQNVKALRPGAAAPSLVLTPQGKVLGKFLLLRDETGFTIISDKLSDAEQIEYFLDSLMQFKVADEVDTSNLAARFETYEIIGPAGRAFLEANGLPAPEALLGVAASGPGCSVVCAPLGDLPRSRVVSGDKELKAKWSSAAGAMSCGVTGAVGGEAAFEVLRVRAGEPVMESDLSEKVLAAELPTETYIALNKGCYAGQEAVEMATARGRPNRRFLRFALPGAHQDLVSGEPILTEQGAPAGQLTSAAYYRPEDRTYVLGFVKTAVLDSNAKLLVGERVLEAV